MSACIDMASYVFSVDVLYLVCDWSRPCAVVFVYASVYCVVSLYAFSFVLGFIVYFKKWYICISAGLGEVLYYQSNTHYYENNNSAYDNVTV